MWEEVWQAVWSWPVAFFTLPFGVSTVFAAISLLGIAGEAVEIDLDGPDADSGSFFSFGGLPITLVFGMLSGFSWISALFLEVLATNVVLNVIGTSTFSVVSWDVVLLGTAGFIAFFGTAQCANLLAPLFIIQTVHTGKTIVGQTAKVISLSVTETHGQVHFRGAKGKSDLTLQVVSDEKNLQENDVVSIVDYDDERNVYHVSLLEKKPQNIELIENTFTEPSETNLEEPKKEEERE